MAQAVSVALLLAALGATTQRAYSGTAELAAAYYRRHASSRHFLERLRVDLADLRQRTIPCQKPLPFEDGPLPEYLSLGLGYRHAVLLEIAGVVATIATGGKARYRITESGAIAPAGGF